MTQPSLYIPHGGGPCFFMDWSPMGAADTWHGMERFLRDLLLTRDKPSAIIVITAHWEAPAFTVTTTAQPSLLFDYYGFPEHTYQLQYPARGAPQLAQQVFELIRDAGLPAATDGARGWDHGVFIPMMLIRPQADIPIVQLSLREGLNPDEHLRLGAALAPLRAQNVLILGSGMSYHNVRALMRSTSHTEAQQFDDWLTPVLAAPAAARNAALRDWQQAPSARAAHPREEHLLPLMACAGAAGEATGTRIYSERIAGNRVSAYQLG